VTVCALEILLLTYLRRFSEQDRAAVALTCMRSLVYLEVLAAREHFAAAWKQTRKWFLSRVDADVVDQLVLGLERSQLTAAVAPQTNVVGLIAAARPRTDVLDADVRHQLVHGGK